MSNFLLMVIINRRHLQHFVIVQIHIPGEMESHRGFLKKVNFTYRVNNLYILHNFTELLMQRNARRFGKQHPDVKCFGRAVFRFLDMQKCRNAGRVKCWKTCQNRKTCHNDTGTKQQNSHVVA